MSAVRCMILALAAAAAGAHTAPAAVSTAPATTTPAAGAATGTARTPVLAALHAETARVMAALRTEGFDKPYYASASVIERNALTQEAAGGALLPLREGRQRWLRVTVRVGSYDLDNSGFLDQMGGRGAGEVVASFPLDDDLLAMRRTMWLAFDEAYKEAGATLAAKQAFLATQGASTKPSFGDFSRETARKESLPFPSISGDIPKLEPLVRRLARAVAVAAEPSAPSARLRVSLVERRSTFIDTEGSELEGGSTFAALEAAAWTDASDGMPLRDLVMRYAASLDQLGSAGELEQQLQAMVASVRAQSAAPALTDSYHGPVLFEGDASAQLLGTILMPRITEPREPISAAGGGSRGAGGEWASKVGSRVLAPLLSVVDDPTLAARGGVALTGGSYGFDFEGVAGRPVTLITNGVLKDFVGTRWPRKGAPLSNGHARRSGGSPWNLGAVPLPSNLIVTAGEGALSREATRKRFVEEIQTRELPWGLVVRRLDDSSILQLGATDWLEVGDLQGRVHENSELEMPVAVFRVTPDGKEERVRGARFGSVPPETLRNLLAVTGPADGETVYNSVLTFDLGYTLSGPVSSSYLPFSMVAPGMVLLEEVELTPIPGPFSKKPLAAARAATGGSAATQPPAAKPPAAKPPVK